MNTNKYAILGALAVAVLYSACKAPALMDVNKARVAPAAYGPAASSDTTSSARLLWKDYFTDPNLVALVDTALKNNQELNITLQEIRMSQNEIRARKGEYLPFIGVKGAAGLDKPGRYTSQGALEESTDIAPGRRFPDPLPDYLLAVQATWEIDIWNKLHNAKKAAVARYLASVEGRNFMVTHLIAEIANSYYELLALDKQLDIVKQNIELQNNALRIVRIQKEAARVTELAVKRFEAQVLKTRSLQFDLQQQITETENRINVLLGRYPQPVARDAEKFEQGIPQQIRPGIPAQLLINRPDVRQAEDELAAAKLDVKTARARFFPSLGISAAFGYNAFNPSYLFRSPESMLYSAAGELIAPLVNRSAIRAAYSSAGAKQIQAVFNYEKTVLNAYVEVANQLSMIGNLEKSYALKSGQVMALSQSVNISDNLFKSARADYMEVLLTQREALEAKFDLIETKKQQLNAMVNVYQALGGGWQPQ